MIGSTRHLTRGKGSWMRVRHGLDLPGRSIGVMDAAAFLARFGPFDEIDADQLRHAAEGARQERFPAGTVIIQRSGAPSESLYVVFEGSVEVVGEGEVLDEMHAGDSFGEMSLITGEEPVATIRAKEDTTCLLLDRDAAVDILGTRPGAAYLTASLRRRFDHLSTAADRAPIRSADTSVGSLIRAKPVVCDPTDLVASVARAMVEAHASAAVVTLGSGLGIITDVDLRTKVIACSLDLSTLASEIATVPVATIAEDALAAEALFQMVRGGFHHLPVVSSTGAVIGIVTETDVIGFGADSPFSIRSAIERAPDEDAAVQAATRLRGSVAALVDGGVDAVHIGHVVGATIDILTRRLLDLAFEEHGDPPVAWAWLAFGSLGRREQALHTDQDHGIAYDGTRDDEERLDPYFERVADSVTRGLESAGLPRCEGNMMAVSSGLRRPLPDWVDALGSWMRGRDQHAAEIAAIVLDFRQVAGPLDVEPALDAVVREAGSEPGFARWMMKHALEWKPPTGRMRDFVVEGSGEHAGSLDVKHGGIMPITDLARTLAVSAGVTSHRTLDRLRLSSEAGVIDGPTYVGLEEAFRLLWQLRLEHQVECVRSGTAPHDFVDPEALSPLRRQGLREALRIVSRAQRAVSADPALAP
jgi:CBS domain-containing protein